MSAIEIKELAAAVRQDTEARRRIAFLWNRANTDAVQEVIFENFMARVVEIVDQYRPPFTPKLDAAYAFVESMKNRADKRDLGGAPLFYGWALREAFNAGTKWQQAHGRNVWKCFHCGEVFTTTGAARDHFGGTQDAVPGCLIKVQLGDERGLLMALRKAEDELQRYRNEDTDLHREIRGLRAQHQTDLRREEEKGYARGLRDGRQLPEHKAGLVLVHDDHKSMYQSAADWIAANTWCDWRDDASKQEAIATDSIWTLRWYPDTPVGFCAVAEPTLCEVLELGLKR